MKPKYSKSATLSDVILAQTERFIRVTRNIGFNEYRITGGEPFLYENISDLLSLLRKDGIHYNLLTNGINIRKNTNLFIKYPPNKVIISYHSKMLYAAMHGIEHNTGLMDDCIRDLCAMGVDLTISVLFMRMNVSDVRSHILHLRALGVKSVKIIYPNIGTIKMSLMTEFNSIINWAISMSGMNIRFSDSSVSRCFLTTRGFLSYLSSRNLLLGCCNSPINRKFIANIDLLENLPEILWKFYNEGSLINEYPCISHVTFCPIALSNSV